MVVMAQIQLTLGTSKTAGSNVSVTLAPTESNGPGLVTMMT